jgi:flagellar assembly factor FliW
MAIYEIKVTFETAEPITSDELEALAVACLVQVEDPADHTGENKRAAFETFNVSVEEHAFL